MGAGFLKRFCGVSHCCAIAGVDGLLPASRCATMGASKGPEAKAPAMGEMSMIGLDLAKSVFQGSSVKRLIQWINRSETRG